MRHLPFRDASADAIAAIHVLEHVYEWEAAPMLREWLRVLKPGGRLVLELPCMDKVLHYIRRCLNEGIGPNLAFSWWALWGDPIHRVPAMCHKWGYTEHSLGQLLQAVGLARFRFEAPKYHFLLRDMRIVALKGG